MVRSDGSYRDSEGKWHLTLGAYELVQHSSDYNVIYLKGTSDMVAFRTTWNASLRIMKLLNDAYDLGRSHASRSDTVNG